MTKLTAFDIEFFELANILKGTIDENSKKIITKTLLKLNNPTYYSKRIHKNPIELHGFNSTRTTNPVLLAISNMLTALKTESDTALLVKKLQTEFAWAFHKFNHYSSVNL
jgi:hypothetical protein